MNTISSVDIPSQDPLKTVRNETGGKKKASVEEDYGFIVEFGGMNTSATFHTILIMV